MIMIEISEGAARKIRTLMAKQGINEGGLRVGVKGGGCSGLSYTFAWEKEARMGDEVFEVDFELPLEPQPANANANAVSASVATAIQIETGRSKDGVVTIAGRVG
jgi:iron-sulfur cluster assembly accessory protein